MRQSCKRDAIKKILSENRTHPTADEVYRLVREQYPNVSLGTVYRNLKTLASEGVVSTLETTDACLHYDGDVSEHCHFVCERCGKIIDIFVTVEPPREIEECGATVTSSKAVFYGVCSDCRKKA